MVNEAQTHQMQSNADGTQCILAHGWGTYSKLSIAYIRPRLENQSKYDHLTWKNEYTQTEKNLYTQIYAHTQKNTLT